MWSAPNTSEDVEILEDRIGRTGEPVGTPSHLCRYGSDVVAQHLAHRPAEGKMPIEAVTLVLGQDRDLPVPAVHEIRQREVDESVDAAKGNGRFRTIPGERPEALAFSTCKDEGDDFRFHIAKPSRRRTGSDRACAEEPWCRGRRCRRRPRRGRSHQ